MRGIGHVACAWRGLRLMKKPPLERVERTPSQGKASLTPFHMRGQVSSPPSVLRLRRNPPPPQSIQYKRETIAIKPIPDSVSSGAGWVVNAFARGDSLVRGYIDADETARRDLATVKGITFEGTGMWSAVVVDWVGLHELSHEGYVLLAGPPPITAVPPTFPPELIASMTRDGVTDISCTVRFAIDAEGNVIDAQISVASGYESADRSALEAIMRYQYGPASTSDRPVFLETDMRFDFSLSP